PDSPTRGRLCGAVPDLPSCHDLDADVNPNGYSDIHPDRHSAHRHRDPGTLSHGDHDTNGRNDIQPLSVTIIGTNECKHDPSNLYKNPQSNPGLWIDSGWVGACAGEFNRLTLGRSTADRHPANEHDHLRMVAPLLENIPGGL